MDLENHLFDKGEEVANIGSVITLDSKGRLINSQFSKPSVSHGLMKLNTNRHIPDADELPNSVISYGETVNSIILPYNDHNYVSYSYNKEIDNYDKKATEYQLNKSTQINTSYPTHKTTIIQPSSLRFSTYNLQKTNEELFRERLIKQNNNHNSFHQNNNPTQNIIFTQHSMTNPSRVQFHGGGVASGQVAQRLVESGSIAVSAVNVLSSQSNPSSQIQFTRKSAPSTIVMNAGSALGGQRCMKIIRSGGSNATSATDLTQLGTTRAIIKGYLPTNSTISTSATTMGSNASLTNLIHESQQHNHNDKMLGINLRCICGYKHDDGSMIRCESCQSWQHIVCIYPDNKFPTTYYKCDKCEPRHLDYQRASQTQLHKLIQAGHNPSDYTAAVYPGPQQQQQQQHNDIHTTNTHHHHGSQYVIHLQSANSSLSADTHPVSAPSIAVPPGSPRTSKRKQDLISLSNNNTSVLTNSNNSGLSTNHALSDSFFSSSGTTGSIPVNGHHDLQTGGEVLSPLNHSHTPAIILDSTHHHNTNNNNTITTNSISLSNGNNNCSLVMSNSLKHTLNQMHSQGLLQPLANEMSSSSVQLNIHTNLTNQQLQFLKHNNYKLSHTAFDLVTHKYKPLAIKVTEEFTSAEVLMEYNGDICLVNEILHKYDYRQTYNPNYMMYEKFNGLSLCIDTNKVVTNAGFIRRSCTPNAELRHRYVSSGQLHIYVVPINRISKNTEITLGYGFDFTQCLYPVDCACMQSSCQVALLHSMNSPGGIISHHALRPSSSQLYNLDNYQQPGVNSDVMDSPLSSHLASGHTKRQYRKRGRNNKLMLAVNHGGTPANILTNVPVPSGTVRRSKRGRPPLSRAQRFISRDNIGNVPLHSATYEDFDDDELEDQDVVANSQMRARALHQHQQSHQHYSPSKFIATTQRHSSDNHSPSQNNSTNTHNFKWQSNFKNFKRISTSQWSLTAHRKLLKKKATTIATKPAKRKVGRPLKNKEVVSNHVQLTQQQHRHKQMKIKCKSNKVAYKRRTRNHSSASTTTTNNNITKPRSKRKWPYHHQRDSYEEDNDQDLDQENISQHHTHNGEDDNEALVDSQIKEELDEHFMSFSDTNDQQHHHTQHQHNQYNSSTDSKHTCTNESQSKYWLEEVNNKINKQKAREVKKYKYYSGRGRHKTEAPNVCLFRKSVAAARLSDGGNSSNKLEDEGEYYGMKENGASHHQISSGDEKSQNMDSYNAVKSPNSSLDSKSVGRKKSRKIRRQYDKLKSTSSVIAQGSSAPDYILSYKESNIDDLKRDLLLITGCMDENDDRLDKHVDPIEDKEENGIMKHEEDNPEDQDDSAVEPRQETLEIDQVVVDMEHGDVVHTTPGGHTTSSSRRQKSNTSSTNKSCTDEAAASASTNAAASLSREERWVNMMWQRILENESKQQHQQYNETSADISLNSNFSTLAAVSSDILTSRKRHKSGAQMTKQQHIDASYVHDDDAHIVFHEQQYTKSNVYCNKSSNKVRKTPTSDNDVSCSGGEGISSPPLISSSLTQSTTATPQPQISQPAQISSPTQTPTNTCASSLSSTVAALQQAQDDDKCELIVYKEQLDNPLEKFSRENSMKLGAMFNSNYPNNNQTIDDNNHIINSPPPPLTPAPNYDKLPRPHAKKRWLSQALLEENMNCSPIAVKQEHTPPRVATTPPPMESCGHIGEIIQSPDTPPRQHQQQQQQQLLSHPASDSVFAKLEVFTKHSFLPPVIPSANNECASNNLLPTSNLSVGHIPEDNTTYSYNDEATTPCEYSSKSINSAASEVVSDANLNHSVTLSSTTTTTTTTITSTTISNNLLPHGVAVNPKKRLLNQFSMQNGTNQSAHYGMSGSLSNEPELSKTKLTLSEYRKRRFVDITPGSESLSNGSMHCIEMSRVEAPIEPQDLWADIDHDAEVSDIEQEEEQDLDGDVEDVDEVDIMSNELVGVEMKKTRSIASLESNDRGSSIVSSLDVGGPEQTSVSTELDLLASTVGLQYPELLREIDEMSGSGSCSDGNSNHDVLSQSVSGRIKVLPQRSHAEIQALLASQQRGDIQIRQWQTVRQLEREKNKLQHKVRSMQRNNNNQINAGVTVELSELANQAAQEEYLRVSGLGATTPSLHLPPAKHNDDQATMKEFNSRLVMCNSQLLTQIQQLKQQLGSSASAAI